MQILWKETSVTISFLIARDVNIFILDDFKFCWKMTGRKDAHLPVQQIGMLYFVWNSVSQQKQRCDIKKM